MRSASCQTAECRHHSRHARSASQISRIVSASSTLAEQHGCLTRYATRVGGAWWAGIGTGCRVSVPVPYRVSPDLSLPARTASCGCTLGAPYCRPAVRCVSFHAATKTPILLLPLKSGNRIAVSDLDRAIVSASCLSTAYPRQRSSAVPESRPLLGAMVTRFLWDQALPSY